ncbi:MAG: 3-dehydroquinate synthase II [Candidatus Nitrosocaldaceae archaeon]
MRLRDRELIVYTNSINEQLRDVLNSANIKKIYTHDPSKIDREGFEIISESNDADYIVYDRLEDIIDNNRSGFKIRVKGKEDEETITKAVGKGAKFIIVEADDWKIIPLENIIARLEKSNTKIYTLANNAEEVRTMFNVLQLGVDGVILNTTDPSTIRRSLAYISSIKVDLKVAEITDIMECASGERVCVDTISILKYGEGMLIGNRSNFLFLVHNESIGSSFTSPRPFRVNAGAVHCYTLLPNGKTKYLSEIESGDEVLIVSKDGSARSVTVGRAKIETRPMILIKAIYDDEVGSIIVQNAETIRFVKGDGSLASVTELRKGDRVFVSVQEGKGRHFGMAVNEYIMEK